MTLIAGVVENGHVVLGGDSGWDAEFGHKGSGISAAGVMPLPKVHRVTVHDGSALVWGACGNWAACQVIQHRLQWQSLPVRRATTAEQFLWCVRDAVLALFFDADAMTDREYETHTDQDEEGLLAFEMLVGWRGTLWSIDGSGSVGIGDQDWAAVGSGALCGSGALHATRDLNLGPEQRINRAMEAASYTQYVIQPPYILVTTA